MEIKMIPRGGWGLGLLESPNALGGPTAGGREQRDEHHNEDERDHAGARHP